MCIFIFLLAIWLEYLGWICYQMYNYKYSKKQYTNKKKQETQI